MKRNLTHLSAGLALGLLAAAPGCSGTTTPGDNQDMSMPSGDMKVGDNTCAPFTGDIMACKCSPDDYAPRFDASVHDSWPACTLSDKNSFKLIGMSAPASAARSVAFETMATRLWKNANAPMAADFTAARDAYSVAEGLASRVQRRQDVAYPEIPGDNKLACSDANIAAMYPDRCAGPGRLLPIINDAFQKGTAGTMPRVQAARIEAALLWFMKISITSEQWTCSFDDIEDCDAQWGYYNGAKERGESIGLGAYVAALHPETHNRIYDGLLAARCWRELDQDMPAKRMDLYQRATAQTDKALLRGVGLILRDRLGKLKAASGDVQDAHLAFINVLGERLDYQARNINAQQADALKAEVSKTTAASVDVTRAQAAIDALFPCP